MKAVVWVAIHLCTRISSQLVVCGCMASNGLPSCRPEGYGYTYGHQGHASECKLQARAPSRWSGFAGGRCSANHTGGPSAWYSYAWASLYSPWWWSGSDGAEVLVPLAQLGLWAMTRAMTQASGAEIHTCTRAISLTGTLEPDRHTYMCSVVFHTGRDRIFWLALQRSITRRWLLLLIPSKVWSLSTVSMSKGKKLGSSRRCASPALDGSRWWSGRKSSAEWPIAAGKRLGVDPGDTGRRSLLTSG